ncbi:DNA polymerase III subunit beta family protein [Streptomyces sp. NPDC001984]
MSVTINAHQLGRLIDQTSGHIGSEYNEQLHGIRLEVDSHFLYAVATDRFTLAVARYALTLVDEDRETWARTIPAGYLTPLREWAGAMQGAEWVTVSTAKERLIFEGPQTSFSIAVDLGIEYPDWRGVLRKAVDASVEGEPFPALNSELAQRFGESGHILRVRTTDDQKPVLFFGEDFIGAQMPTRRTQFSPGNLESFPAAYSSWQRTLAAGSKDADMAALPADERPRYEATTDVQETGESLLRGVLRSTSNALDAGTLDEDREAFHAFIHAGVADWMAYRYLDALHQVDPRAAQTVVRETADELDSGELGEFAWDSAEAAGLDPKKWRDDYDAAVRKRNAEQPPLSALKLAAGLNVAKNFGIAFDIDDNPHVRFDEDENAWVAVKPEPAEAVAT